VGGVPREPFFLRPRAVALAGGECEFFHLSFDLIFKVGDMRLLALPVELRRHAVSDQTPLFLAFHGVGAFRGGVVGVRAFVVPRTLFLHRS